MKRNLSSPSPQRLRGWRLFFESALALGDVLDAELEQAVGISQRWYDVLVHLEESPDGIPMNELAERILYSKSGFTRVVDRMEEEGLVRRVRPEHDRRSILVVLTDKGIETMEEARRYHRDGILLRVPSLRAPLSTLSTLSRCSQAPLRCGSSPDCVSVSDPLSAGVDRSSRVFGERRHASMALALC